MTEDAGAAAPARGGSGKSEQSLASELTGVVRCASCRYELRGLSVRDRCPECGLAISATLLSLIDPHADELRPIERPRLVAAGLACWAVCSLVAVALGWLLWLGGVSSAGVSTATEARVLWLGAAMIGLAGIGSVAIARPHGGVSGLRVGAALVGSALHLVAIRVWLDLGAAAASGLGGSLLAAWTREPEAAPWRAERVAGWLLLAAIVVLLRSNLRMLAARSFLLRSARVDRQTLLAVVVSLLVAALGDVVVMCGGALGGGVAGTALLVGEALVGLGAVLVTIGAVGVVVDTFRLLPSVLRRPLGYADAVSERRGD